MNLPVLYLDNHLLVVNKPAGLLSQADRTGDADVLTLGKAYLKEKFNKPGAVFLGLVQRLDRPVPGVMVLARTSKAAARLTEQFRELQTDKRYIALVEGRLEGKGQCLDYLAKEDRRVRLVREGHPEGKKAELSWEALGCRDGVSLVEILLETGRKHQIRIQLAQLGFPLVGDLRYGARREFDGRNLALHCWRLGLTHPTRREAMAWSVAPPDSWRGFFEAEIARLTRPTD